MSTDHDVSKALRELAEDAPPVAAIATDRAVRRIRRARLVRQCSTAALSVAATAAVVAGAITVTRLPVDPADPQPPASRSQAVPCLDGAGIIGGMSTDGSPLVMTMTAAPPLSVADGTPQVSVVVTNHSDAVVSAITSPHPDVVLVRDGVAVTAPVGSRSVGVQLELAPGAERTFTTPVSLTDCRLDRPEPEAPDKVAVSAAVGPPISPGAYQMYASQTFLVRDAAHPDGYQLEVRGGPWDIAVR